MKSYTDIEQSKKLAMILPLESADNYYSWHDERYYVVSKDSPYPYSLKEKIPCWSLAALLELTPNDVSLLHFEDAYQAVYDVKPYYITNKFDNPLDAAFEMVCWLKENKYI